MPLLWWPDLAVLLKWALLRELGSLEPNLSSNTEVGHDIENDLLQHRVFGQLLEDVGLGVELIWIHGGQIHNIANIEIVDPIIVVLDSKGVTHIDLELVQLFKGLNLVVTGKAGFLLVSGDVVRVRALWGEF